MCSHASYGAERKAVCIRSSNLSAPLIFTAWCDGENNGVTTTRTTITPPLSASPAGHNRCSPGAPPLPYPRTLVYLSLLVLAPSIVSAGSNVCQVCWQAAANELAGVYIIFSGAPKSPPAGAPRLTRLMTPDPLRLPLDHLTSWEQWCQALLGHSSLTS